MFGQIACFRYRRADQMAASGAHSSRSWLDVNRQELPDTVEKVSF
jgi:hypothetical protein